MSYNELIIDTIEPEDKEIMYIHPSRLNTSKFLAPNIFDHVLINHSTVEQITSNGLSGVFASLKPLGKINIIVYQPIGVMVFYDSKQIEANLKLAGFENIKIKDINYQDEKTKHNIQTQEIEAEKPESKRNYDIVVEVKKTTYKEKIPIENNKIYTTKVETENKYKPKNNKTYVKKEIKEEIIEEKKEGNNNNNNNYRQKNRTYVVREQKVENDENNNKGERKSYFRRRFRGNNEN